MFERVLVTLSSSRTDSRKSDFESRCFSSWLSFEITHPHPHTSVHTCANARRLLCATAGGRDGALPAAAAESLQAKVRGRTACLRQAVFRGVAGDALLGAEEGAERGGGGVAGRQLPLAPAEPSTPEGAGNLGARLHSDSNQCLFISWLYFYERQLQAKRGSALLSCAPRGFTFA